VPGSTEEMVEAFIETGFLSYDDLTLLEPAQLGELAGVTEDQAEEMIEFAEVAAERVEEEQRLAKAQEAQERAEAPQAAPRPGAPRPEDLFPPEEAPAAAAPPAKPTFESIFGPDTPPAPEETLSAAQVFGDAPPAGAEK